VSAMADSSDAAADSSADEAAPQILVLGEACEDEQNVSQSDLDAEFAVLWGFAERPARAAPQPQQSSTKLAARYSLAQRSTLAMMWGRGLTQQELIRVRTGGGLPDAPQDGRRMQQLHAAFFERYREDYDIEPLFWGAHRHPDLEGVRRNVQTEAKICLVKQMVDHNFSDLPRRIAGETRRQRTPQLMECIELVLTAKKDGDEVRPYYSIEELHGDSDRFRALMVEMRLTDLPYVWKEMQIVCWLTRHQRLARYKMQYSKKRDCAKVQRKAREGIGMLPLTFNEGCELAVACSVRVR
jgi:hypothetical protein